MRRRAQTPKMAVAVSAITVVDARKVCAATRQELDEALGVTTYMGGGPSLMYAANAIAAFDEFARAAVA
jgi:alkylhydroperoxidase/carboxymuconolactone decarboxylase family protein YurZ